MSYLRCDRCKYEMHGIYGAAARSRCEPCGGSCYGHTDEAIIARAEALERMQRTFTPVFRPDHSDGRAA